MSRRLRLCLWLSLVALTTSAQQLNVFYLIVGNAHYLKDKSKIKDGSEPFDDVNGARKSARYIQEIFDQYGQGKGIMLRSEAGNLLSRKTIIENLETVISLAKKAKASNPLIVFYYCGHGVAEGISWRQFLVPGDFAEKPPNISTNPVAVNLEALGNKLLDLGEITGKLSDAGLPYLCLIDACYEGAEEKFSALDRVMTPTAIDNLKDIAKVLRFMNEYHQPQPVVFATAPGSTVQVTEDPEDKEGAGVGPLCRRMMVLKNKLGAYKEMSLMDVVVLLKDPQLDGATNKAVSNCEFDDEAMKILLKAKL